MAENSMSKDYLAGDEALCPEIQTKVIREHETIFRCYAKCFAKGLIIEYCIPEPLNLSPVRSGLGLLLYHK